MLWFLATIVELNLELLKERQTIALMGAQYFTDLKLVVMASSYDDFASAALWHRMAARGLLRR